MSTGRVAVVGGGLGGLAAAGLLAKQGHAVTLYEGTSTLGGKAQCVQVEGLKLDTGPTLLTLPEVVRDVFRRLEAESLLPAFHALDPQCTYHFKDGCQFVAYPDVERTAESALELRPSERRGVRGFYAEAEAIWRAAGEPYLEAAFEGMPGFMARVARRGMAAVLKGMRLGTLDDLARAHFKTDHMRQFVGRFATYTGASPYQASAAFALIPHIERAFGVHHVQGGMGALVEALAQAVRRQGVQVHLGVRASWAQEGRGWRVGPPGGEQSHDAVVVNADPLQSLGRTKEPLALSGYVMLLEVRGRPAIPHHTVLFGGDYRREFDDIFSGQLAEDPTVYVCNPSATDASVAPEDRTGLYVMVNAPALPREARAAEAEAARWPGHAEKARRQMMERMVAVWPELKGKMRVVGQRSPVDLAAQGAPGGSIYGFLPHGRFGPFRRPHLRGRQPGLFYAGGGTHPGGGVPMVLLSGRFVADMVGEHLRRKV